MLLLYLLLHVDVLLLDMLLVVVQLLLLLYLVKKGCLLWCWLLLRFGLFAVT